MTIPVCCHREASLKEGEINIKEHTYFEFHLIKEGPSKEAVAIPYIGAQMLKK